MDDDHSECSGGQFDLRMDDTTGNWLGNSGIETCCPLTWGSIFLFQLVKLKCVNFLKSNFLLLLVLGDSEPNCRKPNQQFMFLMNQLANDTTWPRSNSRPLNNCVLTPLQLFLEHVDPAAGRPTKSIRLWVVGENEKTTIGRIIFWIHTKETFNSYQTVEKQLSLLVTCSCRV